jgi:hypothetical protein
MAALAGYLQAVRKAYDRQDGPALSALFDADGPSSGQGAACEAARSHADVVALCGRNLQAPMDEVRAAQRLT